MKSYTTLFVVFALAFSLLGTPVASAQISSTNQQIAVLLELLGKLQIQLRQMQAAAQSTAVTIKNSDNAFTYTVRDDGKSGKVKLTAQSPRSKDVFNKDVANDSVAIFWKASNVPENSVAEVTLKNLELFVGGSVGGGTWVSEVLPKGDASGAYRWKIDGIGLADPGRYSANVLLRECNARECQGGAPVGKEKRIFYVNTKDFYITSEEYTDEIADFEATLNGKTIESKRNITELEASQECEEIYNDYDTYNFSGNDLLKCYWDGDVFETVDGWKG
jgi:hypothetical protein